MNEFDQPARCGARRGGTGGIPRRTIAALAVAACFTGGGALANPTNPTVAHGAANFANPAANVLNVTTATSKTIINWGSFSIAAGELTKFLQPSAASAVLNRVAAGNPSQILGALQSNGRVFLINPSGIVFGAGAQIDVAGLIASTLNLSDTDFLAGRMRFTETPGAGSLVNQGAITTPSGGNVYLVGPAVTNNGIITSPKGEVVLAAGNRVELVDPATPNLRVEIFAPDNEAVNLGRITAEAGRIGIYAGLINQRGTVSADSVVVGENGSIVLRATRNSTLDAGSTTTANGPSGGAVTIQSGDTTMVLGSVEAKGADGKGGTVQVLGNLVGLSGNVAIDASGQTGGGTVLVGGDFQGKNPDVQNAFRTYVGRDAAIKADAIESGDGGKVIVWADDITRYYGAISARGGAQAGNGGFVEVSGKGVLDYRGQVSVSAPHGHGGTLLLDPTNIIVQAGAGVLDAELNGSADKTIEFAVADGANSFLNVTELTAGFASGDTITLQAKNDIQFNTSATLQSGVSLTLQAGNNINIGTTANATITAQGTGTLKLSADDAASTVGAADGFGTITIGSGTNTGSLVTADQPITLQGAALSIDATKGSVNAGTSQVNIFTSQPATATIGVGTATGSLTLNNTTMGRITAGTLVVGDIATQQGNITIKGATPPTGKHFTAAQLSSGTGTIVLDDSGGVPLTTGTGNISLSAGTGGITANISNTTAEVSTTGTGTVTLNTSGPIGNTTNRIQFGTTRPNSIVIGDVTPSTSGVFLEGLGDLTLGAITTGGTAPLDIQSAKAILQNGPMVVGGTTRVVSSGADGDGRVYLDWTGNAFGGLVTLGGAQVRVRSHSGDLALAPFTVEDFDGEAFGGELKLSGAYEVTGGTVNPTPRLFLAGFPGGIRLDGNTTLTSSFEIRLDTILRGGHELTLNNVGPALGFMTLNGTLGDTGVGDQLAKLTIDTGNNIALPAINVTGAVDIQSAKAILQNGPMVVGGTTRVVSSGADGDGRVYLDWTGNAFGGLVTLGGAQVRVRSHSGDLALAPFTVEDFDGEAFGGELKLSGAYEVTGGTVNPTPRLFLAGFPGGIRLDGNTTLTSSFEIRLDTILRGGHELTLNNVGPALGFMTLNGTLGDTGVGDQLAKLTIDTGNNIALPAINVTGAVDIQSAKAILQNGPMVVGGTTRVVSSGADGDGRVYLDWTGNAFGGLVTLGGAQVRVRSHSGDLALAPFTVEDFDGEAFGGELKLSGAYEVTGGTVNPTPRLFLAGFPGGIRLDGNTTLTSSFEIRLDTILRGGHELTLNNVGPALGFMTLNGTLGDTGVGDQLAKLTIDTSNNFLFLPDINVTGAVDLKGPSVNISGNISAQSIVASATGGNFTIDAGRTLTASGTGNAIVLAASGNFVNNSGAGALATPAGRWLVYSNSPAGSTENGLTAAAGSAQPRLYNRTFAANGPGSITQPGNHLIYSFQPTLDVMADAATRPYGAADPAYTFTIRGLFADVELTDTLAGAGFAGALGTNAVANSPVAGGPYAITLSGLTSGAGYAINFTGANLTLTPTPLTIAANNATRLQGDPNPAFMSNFNGYVLGETSANLIGALALSTTATASSPTGSYPITLSGLSSTNYAITYVPGVLTVTSPPPPPLPVIGDLPENSALIVALDRSGRFDDFLRDRDVTIRRVEDEKQGNPNICR